MQMKMSLTGHFQCLVNTTTAKKVYQVIKPKHYLSIHVSLRWRLLSKDKGRRWVLMTHERYNKQIKF